MKTFRLLLHSATQFECIDDVVQFIAEDSSGSFGIMAGHGRFMTALNFGMARIQNSALQWEYIAVPGALAYFDNNSLILNTRRYIRNQDYREMSQDIQNQLLQEEQNLQTIKRSLHQMEEQMLRRMWEMRRSGRPTV